jgi:small subunit ribosomal protein S1
VIEFNKEARKIVVSHTRVFEEGEDERPTGTPTTKKKASVSNDKAATTGNKAVDAINSSNEKSTLGDLDALSALKTEMEKDEQ